MPTIDSQPGAGQRALILGCGSIGRRHAANLLILGASDLLLYDPDASRAQQLASDLGARAFSDLAEAFDAAPTMAVVAAPTRFHIELATAAAENGCHLFIEKPLSDSLAGVAGLAQAVKERELLSIVGCNMRWHPALVRIAELIASGALGKIVSVRAHFGQYLPDWHPWEDYRLSYSARSELGGGIILDAIHEIDYVRWLMMSVAEAGDAVQVACMADTLGSLEIDTEDSAGMLIRFGNGALAEVHVDYLQRAYSRGCEVIGEEGTVRWDVLSGETRWYIAEIGQWFSESLPEGWEPNQMYLDEMSHFLRVVAGQEESVLDVAAAEGVLRLALAAKESSRTRRFVDV